VWHDAGYRCYGGDCDATGDTLTYTYGIGDPDPPAPPAAPSTTAAYGLGNCDNAYQTYASSAWELAGFDATVGSDTTFATDKYLAWKDLAAEKCLEKDGLTDYVSVWFDAGYRCYKGGCTSGATANGHSLTFTYKLVPYPPTPPPPAPSTPPCPATAVLSAASMSCEGSAQGANLGAFNYGDTYDQCTDLAVRAGCTTFMFSSSYPVWGCRCCDDPSAAGAHALWNLYTVQCASPAPISVHGDPMFKSNGTGTHFWLKDGVLTPLLLWRSSDGNHTLELSGRTFAREATGDQWFKQFIVAVDGTKLLDVAARSEPRAHEGLIRVTRPSESKLPAGVADVANIDVADDRIKVEANGVYFEVRPTEAAKFSGKAAKAHYEHLNVNFERGIPTAVGASGLFAQLAGIEPMLASTKEMLVRPAPPHKTLTPAESRRLFLGKPVHHVQKKPTIMGERSKKP